MLDHNELNKYFTKSQQQDIIELNDICMKTPPGRIRKPRVRKFKPGYIPRPVNSFMSFRTEKQSIIRKFCPTANHRDISKVVAKWWHEADQNEKSYFVTKAIVAKRAHTERYPDYVFRPKSKNTKKKRSKKHGINASPVDLESQVDQDKSSSENALLYTDSILYETQNTLPQNNGQAYFDFMFQNINSDLNCLHVINDNEQVSNFSHVSNNSLDPDYNTLYKLPYPSMLPYDHHTDNVFHQAFTFTSLFTDMDNYAMLDSTTLDQNQLSFDSNVAPNETPALDFSKSPTTYGQVESITSFGTPITFNNSFTKSESFDGIFDVFSDYSLSSNHSSLIYENNTMDNTFNFDSGVMK
ncbi:uncharacterized protein B0P05DRAFT_594106 [Gilbertella persicaria]|uniref:uncharacterized protein n=1 Tax=Gilbertella persicaria TaxID=101096 RepID=UPI00221F2910|nr:uncharacterized protein B0P05DRAFT_594106 [Gilbertella persicaria]KAI8091365.1 hypothetical protein B0P05DRAFT_594106 [Gilbertella persicaria]